MGQSAGDILDSERVELGELSSSLGFLLRVAQLQAFDAFFNRLAPDGLKPGEFTMLWVVGLNPGLRQGTVARTLAIKPAHMTKLVQRMVDAGYLLRKTPDNDRRSVHLSLTDKGQEFVASNRDAFLSLHGDERATLTPEEADHLVTLLRRFTGFED
ncbi:MAG: MarR family transcriptional regulator [Maritimibacter sp.]|jgi:DNA-binding MarR family transcriptional regulator